MSSPLQNLPPEILFQILIHLSHSHASITALSSTCHDLHNFTSPTRNPLLWQSIFLQTFDDPFQRWSSLTKTPRLASTSRQKSWSWFLEFRRRIVALRHLKAGKFAIDTENDPQHAEEVISTILDIIDTAKSCLTSEEIATGKTQQVDDRAISLNLGLLPINYNFTPEFDGLVRGLPASMVRRNAGLGYYGGDTLAATSVPMPGAFDYVPHRDRVTTRLQASQALDKIVRSENASRLHVLCGLTELEEVDEKCIGRARRLVYDWELTDERTEWGPFKADGSGEVDWRRLEAVVTVAARQFNLAVKGRMIMPQSMCFSLPYRTLLDPTVPEDWARVHGIWCGTYM